MTARIQVRRDTSTKWNTVPYPVLADGEIGYDKTLKQAKVGDGTTSWPSLSWLGGTLPYFASPSSNIDDAASRVPGVYRFGSVTGLTGTLPAAPIDIKAADGGINMLVLAFGSIVMQHLWTDGDGSQPQKSYSRIYDAGYRAWVPQNNWAMSNTEGVEIVAKSIDLKADASIAGITSFGDGAAGTPSLTNIGDTNTGIYFPNADEVAVATAGVQAVLVGSSQGVTCKANVQIDGTLDMTSGLINNVANPSSAQDAATKNYVDTSRIGQVVVILSTNNALTVQPYGTATTGFSIGAGGLATLTSPVGTWTGFASGTNNFAAITTTTSSTTLSGGTGALPTSQATFFAVLVRTS